MATRDNRGFTGHDIPSFISVLFLYFFIVVCFVIYVSTCPFLSLRIGVVSVTKYGLNFSLLFFFIEILCSKCNL